uniref:Uncharacterized protein n=1 Tax=Micrurus spixii TaxID=129469 RepID=A0A2D4LMB1_9SAUR
MSIRLNRRKLTCHAKKTSETANKVGGCWKALQRLNKESWRRQSWLHRRKPAKLALSTSQRVEESFSKAPISRSNGKEPENHIKVPGTEGFGLKVETSCLFYFGHGVKLIERVSLVQGLRQWIGIWES